MVLVVGRILFHGEHDRVGAHEPRDVVDVAVRVIALAALAEPDGAVDAEPIAEDALVACAVEPRVPLLDG